MASKCFLIFSTCTCKTNPMGRFASTVEFYARFREPYPTAFFRALAERLSLQGTESLLDVGCGPAPLAIGFAPFVHSCTGIDPEDAMIAAAKAAASNAAVGLTLVHGRIEEFPLTELSSTRSFDIITIGRALHWLERDKALPILQRIASPSGHVLICGAHAIDTPESPWMKPYGDLRHSFAAGPNQQHYKIDGTAWFEGSGFVPIGTVSVTESRQVTIAELIGRALSKSNTSPEVLGERRTEFETKISETLEPFAGGGILHEQIEARATIFARRDAR
jgi:SAM-dependent methyltransferase